MARAGEDDESILVDLLQVPEHVNQIVFTVNSYTGQTFEEVQNAHCRLVDESTGQELARYSLTGGGAHTGQVMAKVQRDDDRRLADVGDRRPGPRPHLPGHAPGHRALSLTCAFLSRCRSFTCVYHAVRMMGSRRGVLPRTMFPSTRRRSAPRPEMSAPCVTTPYATTAGRRRPSAARARLPEEQMDVSLTLWVADHRGCCSP